jgi:hypothetical protein
VYHRPPGTDAITQTTIASTPYNADVADVEQDLNLPRPIVAGGTGATSAAAALTALGGEQAKQVITDYGAGTFVPGSFYSATSATVPPVANHAFAGICYAADASNMVIQALDITDANHPIYTRVMSAGVWGAFSGDVTANGTITSQVTATTGAYYFGNTGGKLLNFDGTQFSLAGGQLIVNSTIVSNTGTAGTYYFGNTGTKSLSYDGANFSLVGGANFLVGGAVWSQATATTGSFLFGNSGTKNLQYDGTNFSFNGGPLFVNGAAITSTVGYTVRPGSGGAVGGNNFNINWTSGGQLWIDSSNVGTFAFTSDYRIKKEVVDLSGMWDTVKALRPIKYTQAEFSPPSHLAHIEGRETEPAPLFPADDIERWGFIAHELQTTLVPSAATGVKDSPDTIQSPNPWTVIAAMTKALQEAMARIEALEAR